MKKINFQVLTMMLLALLFTDVVPAAENSASKKREGIFCILSPLCSDPIDPPPSEPLGTNKPKQESKTTTEKR